MLYSKLGKPSASSGAALPEFAIVITLLITLFILITEVSRPFWKLVTWLMTTYAAASAGATNTQVSGPGAMSNIANMFYQVTGTKEVQSGQWNMATPVYYSVPGGSGLPLVRVDINAQMQPLMNTSFQIPALGISNYVVAPYLMTGPQLQNPNQFSNSPNSPPLNCLGQVGPQPLLGCDADLPPAQKTPSPVFPVGEVDPSDVNRGSPPTNGYDVAPMDVAGD
ncbi:MAG: pilus assembly protein [Oligoflexia bacterium]|nr:pilus assembly protein [Oligoflexia bacterium]